MTEWIGYLSNGATPYSEGMTAPPYERFTAWKLAHELLLNVYRATKTFPKDELYGLTSQTRRAAFSVAANIAEGSAKRGRAEFRRFLDISIGSLTELAYALRVARDLGYLSSGDWRALESLRMRAGFLTWRLYQAVSKGRPD